MYALQEGTEYAVSTEAKNNKTILFVKLTDSALQAIEKSLNSQDNNAEKTTIQFENDKGTISLPVNGKKQNYRFSLSTIETKQNEQCSFQCVQHVTDRCLESLGSMLMKIQIKANEDSYEKTKFKMEVADKEQKSFCTKEIKPNGARISRKVRLKHPEPILSTVEQYPTSKKSEPSTFYNLQNKSNYSVLLHQPLRKRIIHILAAKAYKKPEILLRLMKDGLNDSEKKEFSTILAAVATLKGNMYNLLDNLWKDVEEDWSFCTEKELQLIQRRKKQYIKPNYEAGDQNIKDSEVPTVHKTNASESSNVDLQPLNKKRRISHLIPKNNDDMQKSNSTGEINSNGIKFSSVNNYQKLSNPPRVINDNFNKTVPKSVNGFHSSCKAKKNSGNQINYYNSVPPPSHTLSSKDISKCDETRLENSKSFHKKIIADEGLNGNIQNGINSSIGSFNFVPGAQKNGASSSRQEKEFKKYETLKKHSLPTHSLNCSNGISEFEIISPVTCSKSFLSSLRNDENFDTSGSSIVNRVSEADCSDIIKEYQPIKSKEQRSQYAEEFNSQYNEYLKLHARMKGVSETFIGLENQLQACKEGSIEFKKTIAKIYLESTTTLQKSDYINAWKKFNFLQLKLSHIKNIIKEYDVTCREES